MGLCSDQSTTYLKGLGYNVVRHPSAAMRPLQLIGVQNGESLYLGGLNQLIRNPPEPVPPITEDVAAADINGKSSSKLSVGVGVNILGSLIGAMGGTLGITLSYTNARKMEFQFVGVTNDSAVPFDVGTYLRDAVVDADNPVLRQYVLGNGHLYLVTKTAKSKTFRVSFERSTGVGATVDVPAIQGLVGGNVKVESEAQSAHTITFEGTSPLVFGFQCFEVGVANGDLTITSVKAGGTFAAVGGAGGDKPVLLPADGLLDVRSL